MRFSRLVIGIALFFFALMGPWSSAEGQEHQERRTLVVHAGRLFTATSDILLTNQDIVIEGDRIVDVGPAGTVRIPAGAQKIDLGNATVLPGMIDGHAHMFKYPGHAANYLTYIRDSWQYRTILATVNVRTDLEAGFTTDRDMMSVGAMYSDTDVRRAVNEGIIPGPRLQVATIALTGTNWGEGYPPAGVSPEVTVPLGLRNVDSPWEGRKAVRENVKYGADFIKIFADKPEAISRFDANGRLLVTSAMTLEEEQAIVDEAHRQGIKAACHAFGGQPMRDSIEAGCNDIEFGVDLDQQSLAKMAQKGIFLTMELTVGKAAEPEELKLSGGKFCRAALQKQTFQNALKAGVKIAFTPNISSAIGHGQQAKEFAMQVQYGMTPAQALRTATIVNAQMMGWDDRIGTIEKGKFADIIAVSGNPLDDITEMLRVKFVMKGGEIVRNDLK